MSPANSTPSRRSWFPARAIVIAAIELSQRDQARCVLVLACSEPQRTSLPAKSATAFCRIRHGFIRSDKISTRFRGLIASWAGVGGRGQILPHMPLCAGPIRASDRHSIVRRVVADRRAVARRDDPDERASDDANDQRGPVQPRAGHPCSSSIASCVSRFPRAPAPLAPNSAPLGNRRTIIQRPGCHRKPTFASVLQTQQRYCSPWHSRQHQPRRRHKTRSARLLPPLSPPAISCAILRS